MNTQPKNNTTLERNLHLIASCLIKQAFLFVVAIVLAPTVMANESASPSTEAVTATTSTSSSSSSQEVEIRSAVRGIMNMMNVMQNNKAKLTSVKVPSCNYLAILQELQRQNAKFLLPGSEIPAEARVIFQLRADQVGLSQTVYFM